MIEPPGHLSDEARTLLLEPLPPIELDFTDADAVISARAEIDAEWEAVSAQLPGSWASRDDSIAGVEVVWFGSDESALDGDDVVVHIHGGAYVFGSPRAAAMITVPLSRRCGRSVVSIDYRLAPEHPCPAGRDDILAAYAELARSRRITGLVGESAGGGLAVATAVALRDAGLPLPARLVLLSPWVDLTCSGDTYRTNLGVDPDFRDPDEPPAWAAFYAGRDVSDPLASPLFADLTGLPPTLIQVGSREILLSDSCRLDAALRAAGVDSTLDVWDGLPHVWHIYPQLPETHEAFDDIAAFLTEDR